MILKVRTVVGSTCLVVGNIATCLVDWAELSRDKRSRRYWRWLGARDGSKLYPDESFVPASWYSSRSRKAYKAQIACLRLTDGEIMLIVFSTDAVLLNAAGCDVLHY